MAGHFRYSVWDPCLIVSQMLTLQCVYYVCLGLWLATLEAMVGNGQSLDHMFDYQELRVRERSGKVIIAAFVFNAVTCATGLWYVVQRTKQCLDFTVTVHLIHLAACWAYNGSFPAALAWWLLCLVCTTLMCVGGEFLCMRTELRAIPVSLGPKADL